MLPRVGAALSKFIAPVASSKNQAVKTKGKQAPPFERFVADKEKSPNQNTPQNGQAKPELRVIKGGTAEETEQGEIPPTAQTQSPAVLSIAHTFLQLFSKFQKQRSSLLRWFGSQSYKSALQRQKKAGKFRKGTMFDKKAE